MGKDVGHHRRDKKEHIGCKQQVVAPLSDAAQGVLESSDSSFVF